MPLGILGGRGMDEFFHCRVEGIFGHIHVYGNKTTTKYQNILEKIWLHFPLPNHL
jgi:hypothetical protein